MMKAKKVKQSKRSIAMAERRAAEMERLKRQVQYDYARGLRDGVLQEKKRVEGDMRVKLLEANIKLAQHIGQMVEATARAVIAFTQDGGMPGRLP